LHLVGILFPHINDDAQSKSHQNYDFIICIHSSLITQLLRLSSEGGWNGRDMQHAWGDEKCI